MEEMWRRLLGNERFNREMRADAVVFRYLESLDIRFERVMGPYYLLELYELYALKNKDLCPVHILIVGEKFGRRYHHVCRGLYALQERIAEKDPLTEQWIKLGLYGWLHRLFEHMEANFPAE